MNKVIVSKIMVLVALSALAGCSNTPAQPATEGGILSATELQSMIEVTVTQLDPIEEQPADEATIIAATSPR